MSHLVRTESLLQRHSKETCNRHLQLDLLVPHTWVYGVPTYRDDIRRRNGGEQKLPQRLVLTDTPFRRVPRAIKQTYRLLLLPSGLHSISPVLFSRSIEGFKNRRGKGILHDIPLRPRERRSWGKGGFPVLTYVLQNTIPAIKPCRPVRTMTPIGP
jgi:hypothetical protein